MPLTNPTIKVTLSGNTAGALAGLSSGTITLAGGNNITLSQAGNAVTISAAAGGAGFAGVGISGGNTAGDTGSVTGRVVFAGGNNVTLSGSTNGGSQTVTISAFNQTTQTQNLHNVTLSGNTAGAMAQISSGTLTLAGGNNVTLSQAGNAVTISAFTQTAQTQNLHNVTLSGNTSGAMAHVSSGTLTLAGGNNVTLSQAGNAVTISAFAQTGTQFSAGLSNIGNTAGDTVTVAGRLVLAGGNNVTLSGSSNGVSETITISAFTQTAQTQNLHNVTLSGNTAGAMAHISSGTLTLAGGNNVTLSQAGNAVTISAFTQTAQTQNLHNVTLSGNTAGAMAHISSGTLTLAGGNNVTLSQAGNAVTISAAAGAAGTAISGIAASNTTYTSGTVSITGVGGGITVSSNTGQRIDLSVAAPVAQTVQTQNLHNVTLSGNTAGVMAHISSGTMTLAGGNNITVSQGGNAVTISGPATAAQTVQTQSNIQSIAASDTTYHTGQVQFTGSNMITVKSSANQRVVIDATQTVQTQSRFNLTLAGNSTSAGGGYIQISSGVMTLAGGNNITLSQEGNAVTVSAGAGGGAFAGGGISGGNTAGDTGSVTGRLIFAGGNNVTLSGSTNGGSQTITVSAFNQTVQTQNLHNLTLGGNTAGAMAAVSSGTLTLAGGNNITLSQAGNAITISGGAGAGGFAGGGISGGNTSGDTGSVTGRLIFAGTPSITLSGSTNAGSMTVTISAPQTTSLSASTNITLSVDVSTIKFSVANPPKLEVYENFPLLQASLLTNIAGISKTPFYWPEYLPGRMTLNSVLFRMSAVTSAVLQSLSAHLGVYTLVNSTSAALLGSVSEGYVVSTASSASWTGQRIWAITGAGTHAGISNLTPGQYIFGMMFSAGATASMNQSLYGASLAAGAGLGHILPGTNQLSTHTSQGPYGIYGRGSTTVNAMPANVVRSELIGQGSGASAQIRPWILARS